MPMNFAKTGLLLVVLTAIFVAVGGTIGGTSGMIVAFVVALAMNLFSLWNADTLVLKMYGAHEVDEGSAPELHRLVSELAHRAELPMPRVYVMHNPQPNAFATGRSPNRAAVCVSTGLLDILDRDELAGVLAHELSHIKNRDTLTMTVAATIGGAISMLAQYMQISLLFGGRRDNNGPGLLGTLLAVIVAPIAASLVQMAISRSREYQADRMGAIICGNPLWLASALMKLQTAARRIVNEPAESVPATAHMFIVNPLSGRGFDNFFSTHPSMENRVAELEALAREMGITDIAQGAPPAPQGQRSGDPWTEYTPRGSGSRGPWG